MVIISAIFSQCEEELHYFFLPHSDQDSLELDFRIVILKIFSNSRKPRRQGDI